MFPAEEGPFPILDEFQARATAGGVLVKARTLDGQDLSFAVHRLALAATAATLLDAGRNIPPGEIVPPAARVAANAVGLAISETGEPLLVLETGGAALSYALPAYALRALGEALLNAFPLHGQDRHHQHQPRRPDA